MQLTCGGGCILAANPAIIPEMGHLPKDVAVVELPLGTWLMPAWDLCHLDVSCMNSTCSPCPHIQVVCRLLWYQGSVARQPTDDGHVVYEVLDDVAICPLRMEDVHH